MSRQNPARPGHPSGQRETLQEISDIKRIMERSSRFISLSGLSGIAAGLCALTGAYFANNILNDYFFEYNHGGYTDENFESLKINLLILAGIVLAAALILSFLFTWRRAKQNHLPYLGLHCKEN
jgi:hypothetical protein